jgi:uncharacterized protein YoaH (UPF0181 family)
VRTVVSPGSVSSRVRIESMIVSNDKNDRPARPGTVADLSGCDSLDRSPRSPRVRPARRRPAVDTTGNSGKYVSRSVIRSPLVAATAISVRLDDDAVRALHELEAAGLSRSEAVRAALVAAARRLRDRQRLSAEVAELEADDEDRCVMRAVAEVMEDLRAPW